MLFDESVTTLTREDLLPVIVDTVLNSNPLTMRLLSRPKKWTGTLHSFAVKWQKNTNGGSFDGLDLFTKGRSNSRVKASFAPKGVYQTISIDNMSVDANNTQSKEGAIDLVEAELVSAQQDMMDSIGDMVYGDGTGNSSKDLTGLLAIADDGTNVATYGNISRTTYTSWRGNYTAASGTLTLAKMATMYDSCTHGNQAPSIIVTTKLLWTALEALITPTLQSTYATTGYPRVTAQGVTAPGETLTGRAGFEAIFFRGKPVVADEKCPTGYMFFLAESEIDFLSLASTKYAPVKPSAKLIDGVYRDDNMAQPMFYWSGWLDPQDQYATTSNLVLLGDFVCRNPRKQGQLRGLTA